MKVNEMKLDVIKCKTCGLVKNVSEYYLSGNGKRRLRCKQCEQLKSRKVFKERECTICGKSYIPISSVNKYCSGACKYKSELLKRSKKTGDKKCVFCGSIFIPYTSLDKFCSSVCRINNMKSKRTKTWSTEKSEKITGENNPAYRNGCYCRNTKIKSHGLREFQRNKKKLIYDMIEGKGYLYCQNCGITNSLKFETHHIIFRSEKPLHDFLHKKLNLIYLCINCHNDFHKQKSMRNKIVTDRGLDKIFGNDILNK